LISSRQIAGHPTAFAISWASVVFPDPIGPLTTTSVGRGAILAVIANAGSAPGTRTGVPSADGRPGGSGRAGPPVFAADQPVGNRVAGVDGADDPPEPLAAADLFSRAAPKIPPGQRRKPGLSQHKGNECDPLRSASHPYPLLSCRMWHATPDRQARPIHGAARDSRRCAVPSRELMIQIWLICVARGVALTGGVLGL
jgi:hypothetical protein